MKTEFFNNKELSEKLAKINTNISVGNSVKKRIYIWTGEAETDQNLQKTLRKKYRTAKIVFCNNLISSYNKKNAENFEKIAVEFLDWYKNHILITDFSVENFHSLSTEKKPDVIEKFAEGLNLLKMFISENKEVETEVKKEVKKKSKAVKLTV